METSGNTWLNHLKVGKKLFAESNYPEAIDEFKKSIALKESWGGYLGLGMLLNQINNYLEAIDAFKKSITLKESWEAYQGLGSAHFRTNSYLAAIDALNKSIVLKEHWATYQGLGWACFHTQNHPAAIEAVNKSIELKEDCNTYQGLGFSFIQTNNYFAAIEAFKRSIVLEENWYAYLGLGRALSRTNNHLAAIEAFKKSISVNENWDTYQALGFTYIQTNNYFAAIQAFKRSIALEENWDAYLGLGKAFSCTKNYPAAIDAFKKSISVNENWDTYQALGFAYTQTNNYFAAIQAFKRSIALKEDWNTYQGLAWAYLHSKSHRKALNAIINSYIISRSNEIKNDVYEIYLQADSEGKCDDMLLTFLEYSVSSKTLLAEDLLRKYIFNGGKILKIDALLMRYASLTMVDSIKEVVVPIDGVLDNLKSLEIPAERDLFGLRRFHRYVFGVSHARLHFVSPNTTVIECGAGTMFSIGDPNSKTKHFQKIVSECENINPNNSVLIFEFGEVDIRNHIFKIAKRKSQSIIKTADLSISRYIDFIVSLKKKGYHVMVSGPHCGGGEHPSTTSAVERNDLCAYVNDALSLECRANGIYFFTLFDIVVNQKTLEEIQGLYYDHLHLCLPPSKIGNALNSLLNARINRAFSSVTLPCQFLQREEVCAKCILTVSDVPGWKTGVAFTPGNEIVSEGNCFEIGQYMMLIELPFLVHPKEISLEFSLATHNIKTAVQGVFESWEVSNEMQVVNVINAYSSHACGLSTDTSIIHSFTEQEALAEKCRFLLLRMSVNAGGNHLMTIGIKRWIHRFQRKLCTAY